MSDKTRLITGGSIFKPNHIILDGEMYVYCKDIEKNIKKEDGTQNSVNE